MICTYYLSIEAGDPENPGNRNTFRAEIPVKADPTGISLAKKKINEFLDAYSPTGPITIPPPKEGSGPQVKPVEDTTAPEFTIHCKDGDIELRWKPKT